MTTIPQKTLRDAVADVLRRAEAGERFTVTVAGRPAAERGLGDAAAAISAASPSALHVDVRAPDRTR